MASIVIALIKFSFSKALSKVGDFEYLCMNRTPTTMTPMAMIDMEIPRNKDTKRDLFGVADFFCGLRWGLLKGEPPLIERSSSLSLSTMPSSASGSSASS